MESDVKISEYSIDCISKNCMLPHYYTPFKIKTNKEETRTFIETIPKVIGEGTYGCVHKPSLRCSNKPNAKNINYEGKISKLGKKKHINKEIKEYATINRIDKRAFFYPGKPSSCYPMQDGPTLEAINRCENFEADNVDKYKLLIIKDGKETLEEFADRIGSGEPVNIDKFWIEAQRLFLGVTKFIRSGVIHHDLKHKNILYDEKQNRTNFIDFGLMTNANIIRNESRESKYGFAIRHWSFPPEMAFINYKKYLGVVESPSKEFKKIINEIKNPNSHINTFFVITDKEFELKKSKSFSVEKHTIEYYNMVTNRIKKSNYNEFLNKTISTIDSYGLALSLIYVLNKSRESAQFANDLYNLFYNMMNFNVLERIGAIDALNRYEDILEKNGILQKYNVYFENHELKKKSSNIKKVQQNLDKIQIPNIIISEKRLESDPLSRCPNGKKINKKNKRCIMSYKKSRTKTRRIGGKKYTQKKRP